MQFEILIWQIKTYAEITDNKFVKISYFITGTNYSYASDDQNNYCKMNLIYNHYKLDTNSTSNDIIINKYFNLT